MKITYVLSLFLLSLLATQVQSQLVPAQITDLTSKSFTSPRDLPNIKGVLQENFPNAGESFLDVVSKSILLELENSQPRYLRWETRITPATGTLQILHIVAEIRDQIYITGKSVKIVQPIPTLYETKEHCTRTGRRRYRIAGPRKWECNYYQVARGLHQSEIDLVAQRLLAKVTEAEKLLE